MKPTLDGVLFMLVSGYSLNSFYPTESIKTFPSSSQKHSSQRMDSSHTKYRLKEKGTANPKDCGAALRKGSCEDEGETF